MRNVTTLLKGYLKPGYVAGFVLLLSLLAAWPVFGQTALEYFAPREVEKVSLSRAVFEPTPAAPRLQTLEELEELAGFSLLVPTYLPPGCDLRERFYLSKPQVVVLSYACVGISEQRGESVQHPSVGKDSTREVTVGGKPALLIDGAWVQSSNEKEATWARGPKNLVFERDNLIIDLMANSLTLTQEELIKIAESLE